MKRRVKKPIHAPRRGMATVLVLAMIAMTLAVSYSLVRTQSSQLAAMNGVDLRNDARQAAYTGFSEALRRMSNSGWAGPDSTFTGTVRANQTFGVTFATGDASLPAAGVGSEDWPYRVTVSATGYAVNPSASSVTTTYKLEAAVRLAPQATATNPSAWASMQQYTLYQTANQNVSLQWPFRIEGPCRFQGGLTTLFTTYPTPSAANSRYFSDLNAMRGAGYGDLRPFSGPIYLPFSATTSTNRSLLTSNLGLVLTNSSAVSTTNWSLPSVPTTYQLYPGGKTYSIVTLPSNISNTSYLADPRANPAGLFYRNSTLTLGDNTTVAGTIIGSGKVRLNGTNISIQAVSLPALDGAGQAVQLPAVVAGSDIEIAGGATATIRGNAVAFSELIIESGSTSTLLKLEGRIICDDLDIQARIDWNLGSSWWSLLWNAFGNQGSVIHFPVYTQASYGLQYAPSITIGPPAAGFAPQWVTPGNPVYAVGSGDSGLRWSVLRVVERP